MLNFSRDHGQRFYEEQGAIGLGGVLFMLGELEEFDAFMESRAGDETFIRNSLLVERAITIGELDRAETLLAKPEQPEWAKDDSSKDEFELD